MKPKIKKLKSSATLLCSVHSTNDDNMDCSYAVLPITKKLTKQIEFMVQQLLNMKSDAQKHSLEAPFKLSVFYDNIAFLSEEEDESEICSEELLDKLSDTKVADAGSLFINDDFLKANEKDIAFVRPDTTQLVVSLNGFFLKTTIKHTNTVLTTSSMLFEDLAKAKIK